MDEQEPLDEQSQVEAGGGRRWMNSSPWRLEEVNSGDEQYPVESRFAVCHTPPDEQDPRFDRSAPTQVRFLNFAVRLTPPDQQDPRFDHRRFVSSIFRYARLGIRDPARMYTYVTVFSFLHPSRSTYVYMLRARLYYDTYAPLLRHVRASTSTSIYVRTRSRPV